MTPGAGPLEQIVAVTRAIVVRPPTRYVWLGVRSAALPRRIERELTAVAARRYLVAVVAECLYRNFYVTGGVLREQVPARQPPADDVFVAELSAANAGAGPWDAGWLVVGVGDDEVSVTKDGLTLRVSPGSCRPELRSEPVVPGAQVDIHLPKERRAHSPGYYTAIGDRRWPAGGGVLRAYWNLEAAAAEPFIGRVTEDLNGSRVPFRVKVLDHPDGYNRCDAGVLYLPPAGFGAARQVLRAVRGAVAPWLKAAVPAFTRPIAPGVAVAAGPADGSSFGLHRCGLVAEGLVRARDMGLRSPDATSEVIRAVFREAGIDPTRPDRAAGSRFEPLPLDQPAT